jgi:predicted GTPase
MGRELTTMAYNCLIMGAAGRDFHDFQMFFRDNPQFRVQGFTATQIPFIAERSFPRELAGPAYDADIPIFPEERLPELIERFEIDFVFLAYSDLAHADVMHKASLVQACGAAFALLGPKQTQLASAKPVIAVTAVRTGAGKSPITQFLARTLADSGRRVGVLRHPMPYGDLARQAVERFATLEDLDRYECTVEEREEYEPYVAAGQVIFAGVDYRRILAAAEPESDVILWDGGNNDYAFVRPGLSIVVADALRAGHEVAYYPGETNFRAADVVVINKVSQADAADVKRIRASLAQLNPRAQVVESDLEILVDSPELIAGRRVLVVEDGPTVTHGGMGYGAGLLAARRYGAGEIIDPRPAAVGTIAEAFEKYPHLESVLPALGYSSQQRGELAATIDASGADVVIDASPASLQVVLDVHLPIVRVRYRFRQTSGPPLADLVEEFLGRFTA